MLKKFTVFLLFVGLIAVIVGVVLSKGDFTELKTTLKSQYTLEYEYKTFEGDGPINGVDIDLTNNNVHLFYSEDETYFIDYHTAEEDSITVTVADGKILMKQVQYRWYKMINFKYKTEAQRKVNIYLPVSFAGDINIDLTSGSVDFKNFTANDVSIDAASGYIDLSNATVNNLDINLTSGKAQVSFLTANNINIDHTSGKVNLEGVIASKLLMNATSGNININNCDIDTVKINLTTGNIYILSLVTDSIETYITSGNTTITLVGNVDDYKAVLKRTVGYISYNGNKYKNTTINPSGTKFIEAYCTSGEIKINFIEG